MIVRGFRICAKCKITADLVRFYQCKDSKNKKIYTHKLCVPCRKERQKVTRKKLYLKNRKYEIKKAREWNIRNRDRYNRNRRKVAWKRKTRELFSHFKESV